VSQATILAQDEMPAIERAIEAVRKREGLMRFYRLLEKTAPRTSAKLMLSARVSDIALAASMPPFMRKSRKLTKEI